MQIFASSRFFSEDLLNLRGIVQVYLNNFRDMGGKYLFVESTLTGEANPCFDGHCNSFFLGKAGLYFWVSFAGFDFRVEASAWFGCADRIIVEARGRVGRRA